MKRLCLIIIIFLVLFEGTGKLLSRLPQTTMVYKIQVASLPNQVSNERVQRDLHLNQTVTMHHINGRYKYFVGQYDTWDEANSHLPEVHVNGAYVVKVSVNAVDVVNKTVLEKKPPQETKEKQATGVKTVKEEMTYRIQIAASRTYIRPVYFRDKLGLDKNVDYFRQEGFYKYVIGDYESIASAEEAIDLMGLAGKSFAVKAPIERKITQPVNVTPSLAEGQKIPVTGQTESQIIVSQPVDTSYNQDAVRTQYTLKIQQADSAFFVKDYKLARRYYSDARVMAPDNTYPRDRIREIDNKLLKESARPLKGRIKLLNIGIIFFIIVMIAVLIVVLILRSRRQKRVAEDEQVRDEYQDSISEYLFDESGAEPTQLRTANTQKKKQILIDEIMQLYANLSGEISNKLRELYLDLDLDNESVKKTKSPQWHVRAKGFRELAQMNIKSVNDEIERCLNSDNDVLRMEAQLAMVRLNFENPFSFLDRLQKPFTSWEQLHVFEMIQRNQIPAPDFTRWLNSPNETVILFCVRMIRAFKQVDAFKTLVGLLGHRNHEVKNETIVTLGELNILDVLPEFKARFPHEDKAGKLLILKAMSKMPEESNIDFLTGILEPSNELRIEAADALSRIESFGVRGIENILQRSDDDLQAVARHILDNKL